MNSIVNQNICIAIQSFAEILETKNKQQQINIFLLCRPTLDFQFNFQEWVSIAIKAIQNDSNLRNVRDQLVPTIIREDKFWRKYFYILQLTYAQTQHDITIKKYNANTKILPSTANNGNDTTNIINNNNNGTTVNNIQETIAYLRRKDLIVSGYIRTEITNMLISDVIIPDVMVKMCTTFYPSYERIDFDILNLKFLSKQLGTFRCRKRENEVYAFYSSKAMSSGVHCWKLKCVSGRFNHDMDVISLGIVSKISVESSSKSANSETKKDDSSGSDDTTDNDDQEEQDSSIKDISIGDRRVGDSYFFRSPCFYHKACGHNRDYVDVGYVQFSKEDEFVCVLDCILWTFTVLKNDSALFEPYKIKPKQSYFPALALHSGMFKFELIYDKSHVIIK